MTGTENPAAKAWAAATRAFRGRLFVPGGDENGADIVVSLAGTWSLAGNRVTPHLDANTFLQDLELIASDRHLVGVYSGSVAVVHVRLQKPATGD